MKTLKELLKWYLLLLVVLMVVMAFDCFDTGHTFWYELACFGMSIIPGALIAVSMILLWKKEYILRYVILVLAIGFFILFNMYQVTEQWPLLVMIFIPMTLYSILSFMTK
ncbi:MAG: hypothetical protein WCR19_03705 [Acholeplasmataceae bacterium]